MNCTDACYAMPECTVCHKRKKPEGRSAPLAMCASVCDQDCRGYYYAPRAGHLWPEENPNRKEGYAHEDCRDDAAEKAEERRTEDFYGSSSPQTEEERRRA
jgi:hypothetical protein